MLYHGNPNHPSDSSPENSSDRNKVEEIVNATAKLEFDADGALESTTETVERKVRFGQKHRSGYSRSQSSINPTSDYSSTVLGSTGDYNRAASSISPRTDGNGQTKSLQRRGSSRSSKRSSQLLQSPTSEYGNIIKCGNYYSDINRYNNRAPSAAGLSIIPERAALQVYNSKIPQQRSSVGSMILQDPQSPTSNRGRGRDDDLASSIYSESIVSIPRSSIPYGSGKAAALRRSGK